MTKRKAKKFFKMGREEYERKNFQKALELYNSALKLDPENGDILFDKAMALLKQKRMIWALRTLKKALKADRYLKPKVKKVESFIKKSAQYKKEMKRREKERREQEEHHKKYKEEQLRKQKEKEEKQRASKKHLCEHCGGEIDLNRNVCSTCGAFYDPIQNALKEKFFQTMNTDAGWLKEAPSFEGMHGKDIPYTAGLKYLEKMELKNALRYYTNHLRNNHDDYRGWNNLGVAYMGLKDRLSAMKHYQKALELNPDYYIPLYNIGGIHYVCGQYEKAIEYFDKAIKINPACGEAHWDKHLAKEELGEFNFRFMFEVQDMGINILRARTNLSSALVDLRNGEDAVLGHYKLILKGQAHLNSLIDKAFEFKNNNELDKALQVLFSALDINSKDPRVLTLMGMVYYLKNNPDLAYEYFTKSLDVDSSSIQAWSGRGGIAMMQGKKREAINAFTNVIKLNPFETEIRHLLENLHIEKFTELRNQGRYEEALALLDETMGEFPFNRISYLINKGVIYIDTQKYKKAMNIYDEVLKSDPNNTSAMMNKASIYYYTKRYDKAIEYYDKILELEPDNQQVKTKRSVVLSLLSLKD